LAVVEIEPESTPKPWCQRNQTMNKPAYSASARLAFSLIELLVVIAIIGILIGLIVPVLGRIGGTGVRTVATSEIGQLDTAIQTFKQTYGVDFIPSQIKLCERLGDYGNTKLDTDSLGYLTMVWPKLLSPGGPAFIDWNGNGAQDGPVILEGHQCLVFFLGGIPVGAPPGFGTGNRNSTIPPACFGFATDPRDPAKLGQANGRKGPFFDFPPGRLGVWSNPNANGQAALGACYFSFFDSYSNTPQQPKDKPYAYFSSYGAQNGYNTPPVRKYGTVSDCDSLGVTPYVSSPAPLIFHNPKSHQIICAGADQAFGPGCFPAGGGPFAYPFGSPASVDPNGFYKDDQSNFNSGNILSVN
jgi:general secretion pathway protein G